MATTTATKAPKAVRVETAKALTKAQQTALDTLVKAANESITGAINSERELANVVTQLADFKVYAARSMARLSTHPAVIASRGTQAGQPALTKMATLIGRPATTLETYWKSAKALIGAKMDKRTGAPTQAERDLVMASFKSESARVASYSKPKGKGGKPASKPATKGTKVTVDSLTGQLTAALESAQSFTKDNGFTKDQADALIAQLDAIHDVIENGTAK